MPQLVDDLETALTLLKVKGKFVLVGHSYGGAVVTEYALKNPDRVERLILMATAGEFKLQPMLKLASESADLAVESRSNLLRASGCLRRRTCSNSFIFRTCRNGMAGRGSASCKCPRWSSAGTATVSSRARGSRRSRHPSPGRKRRISASPVTWSCSSGARRWSAPSSALPPARGSAPGVTRTRPASSQTERWTRLAPARTSLAGELRERRPLYGGRPEHSSASSAAFRGETIPKPSCDLFRGESHFVSPLEP